MTIPTTLTAAAVAILRTADPAEKARLSALYGGAWHAGHFHAIGDTKPPARPARPERPELVPPRAVRRRKIGPSPAGRIALLHALAHIELNAIDLAWDMIARFAHRDLDRDFYAAWVGVAVEEARHFTLLVDRLTALGAAYGDLPAHDGLWEAAEATADDLLARLAVVPMVLEARGLDVIPGMIARLTAAGDRASVEVLEIIYADEIGHVGTGRHWFDRVCEARGLSPDETWPTLVRRYYKGNLKPPFNEAARDEAGVPAALCLRVPDTPRD